MWSFAFNLGPLMVGVAFYHGICVGLEQQELMEIDTADEEGFELSPKNAWVFSLPIVRFYFLLK